MSQTYSFVGTVTVSGSLSPAGLRNLRRYLERAVSLDLDTEEHGTNISGDVECEGVNLDYSELTPVHEFVDLEDLCDDQTIEIAGGCLQFDGEAIRYIDDHGNCENVFRDGDPEWEMYRGLFPPAEFSVLPDTVCSLIVNTEDLIGHPDFQDLSHFEGEFTAKQVAESVGITVEQAVALLQNAYDESYIEAHAVAE